MKTSIKILCGAALGGVVAASLALRSQEPAITDAELTAWNEAAKLDLMEPRPVKDIMRDLTRIQREGNAYYIYNQRASNWLAGMDNGFRVPDLFQVLPKNSAGTCSNTVAIKIQMIREQLPSLDPYVAVYDVEGYGQPVSHTVVFVNVDGKTYWLGNGSSYVQPVDGYRFRSLRTMTLEQAQEFYRG